LFQRRRVRILLALFVAFAIALVTIDFRGGDEGILDRARGGVTAVFRPVQEGVATLVRPFGNLGRSVSELLAIREENERLRDRVAELEERRRAVSDLERENEEYRALLDMAGRTELDVAAARVVALAPSNFEWTVTIDAGSEAGIERGMPVIDGDGLVGRVIQVTPNASRVLLAIDPSFSAAARSAEDGEVGIIGGRGGDPMVLRLLDPLANLQVGDQVVTSSYQGGVFPAGIPIGTVAAVGEGGSTLAPEVQVNPYVDFTGLHHVLVVFSTGVEEIPPFEGSDDLEFERPPVSPRLDDEPADDPDDGGTDADVGDAEEDATADEGTGASALGTRGATP